MDSSGKVTYAEVKGASITADVTQLASVIDDESVTVVATAENTKNTSSGNLYRGGAFMGNTVTISPDGNTVIANQEINPFVLSKMDLAYNKPGATTLHEISEAYLGAVISQALGVSSPMAGQTGSVYLTAHKLATPQSGDVIRNLYDANGRITTNPQNAIRIEYATTNGTIIMTYP